MIIKALSFVVSEKKIFSCFPYIMLYQTCDPGVGPFLTSGAYLIKLGRGPLGDAKYKISRLSALWFQTRRFFHISLCKTCAPLGGPFLALGL